MAIYNQFSHEKIVIFHTYVNVYQRVYHVMIWWCSMVFDVVFDVRWFYDVWYHTIHVLVWYMDGTFTYM